MIRSIFAAAALSGAICCPHEGVKQHGAIPPHYTDRVLEQASKDGCDIKGDIRWWDGAIPNYPANYSGTCWMDSCGFDINVKTMRDVYPLIAPQITVFGTALGHELGHYCLDNLGAWNADIQADKFSAKLYDEVYQQLKKEGKVF